jgi:hypothetical protein
LEPLTNRGLAAKPHASRYVFPGVRSRERPMSETRFWRRSGAWATRRRR